ncbi:TonB-dependent receptor plug domain-containing protein [Aliivibrio salmonicida]|uniref:TonB-dependent receptor plug domain-containing protein n=1 Tax=Aliivibrio salmonicida TaxID=40269 RepID=UPI00406C25C4
MHIRPNTLSFSLFLVSSSALALDADLDLLMSISLEDLSMLEVNVTSASKRELSISDIPAAIYVITNERIVRSGVKSIADVLSLAPGIEVSQFNESSDFVSSRGFHDGLCDLETYTYNNSCRAYETEQSVYGRVSYEF